MPRTINFIDSVIKNLKPSNKREIYWCEGSPGFGLRITPSGTKTFVYKYMKSRKSRWLTIGKYPEHSIREARKQYNEYYEQVIDYGRDPIAEKQLKDSKATVVQTLIDEYIEFGTIKGKKFITEEERYFNVDIIPVIGDKNIDEVTPADIEKIQKNILLRASKQKSASKDGKVATKHAIGCVRRLFNLARKKGLIDRNPVDAIEKLGASGKRDRVLDFKEIWLFWNRIQDANVPPVTANALKFILTTMQRGIEVRNMHYEAIKFDESVWQMETHETKNKKMHRVPLNKLALNIIEKVQPFTELSPFVFGATRSQKIPKNPSATLTPSTKSAYSQALYRNREFLGIDNFCPHDLRRTGATWITAVGLPKLYARLMLNHSDGDRDVTGEVYVQYSYDFEKRKAVDVWAFVLEQIVHCKNIDDVPTLEQVREKVKKSGYI